MIPPFRNTAFSLLSEYKAECDRNYRELREEIRAAIGTLTAKVEALLISQATARAAVVEENAKERQTILESELRTTRWITRGMGAAMIVLLGIIGYLSLHGPPWGVHP